MGVGVQGAASGSAQLRAPWISLSPKPMQRLCWVYVCTVQVGSHVKE